MVATPAHRNYVSGDGNEFFPVGKGGDFSV
jgi:hypothetical protein